jgi:hypothetical protein
MNHNGMSQPKKNILNRWSVMQRLIQYSFKLYTECHVLPYTATMRGLYMSPQLRAHAGKVEGHLHDLRTEWLPYFGHFIHNSCTDMEHSGIVQF